MHNCFDFVPVRIIACEPVTELDELAELTTDDDSSQDAQRHHQLDLPSRRK
jgi:hypothetical protein